MSLAEHDQLPLFARGSDTSKEAAESMRGRAPLLRAKVLEAIRGSGSRGITCDALEVALGLTHQTCSARVNELANLGAIVLTDECRLTRSNRRARVYRAA